MNLLGAAGAGVNSAVGIAEQVVLGGTTLSVGGVLGLPLLSRDIWAPLGEGDLGVLALDVGNARGALAVLAEQALASS